MSITDKFTYNREKERRRASEFSRELLKAPPRVKCPACSGAGQKIDHAVTVRRCQRCDGRGRILHRDLRACVHGIAENRVCSTCPAFGRLWQ